MLALEYALSALREGEGLEKGVPVMISALAPCWQLLTLEKLGYTPLLAEYYRWKKENVKLEKRNRRP